MYTSCAFSYITIPYTQKGNNVFGSHTETHPFAEENFQCIEIPDSELKVFFLNSAF